MAYEQRHKRRAGQLFRTDGIPVSHRVLSHSREAVQQAILAKPHIQWTSIRRDDQGTAWVAYGTEFVTVKHR